MMSLVETLTLAVALLGAVLGILNTWQSMDRTRVKLRIVPKRAIPVGAANPNFTFCIEVINLSEFAVTVEEVGVHYRGIKSRGAYVQPIVADGGAWPRRLEARSAVTLYGYPPSPSNGRPIRCAYARTQCGRTQTGTSPALRSLNR